MSEKENDVTQTLGKAIDEIIIALKPLDENSRITAIRASCEHLKIPLTETGKGSLGGGVQTQTGTSITPKITDIKSFKEQKKPSSASEMAAIVAFYLTELSPEPDRKLEVDTNDMTKYFKQAGFPLPKKPKFLLVNAKNAGYFDSAGSGKYKLNPVGYNLVAHNMPRTQSGVTRTARSRKSAKKKQSATKANRTK